PATGGASLHDALPIYEQRRRRRSVRPRRALGRRVLVISSWPGPRRTGPVLSRAATGRARPASRRRSTNHLGAVSVMGGRGHSPERDRPQRTLALAQRLARGTLPGR